jgi:hypothetical protein
MLDQRSVDRIFIVVLDSLGVGALPDAAVYGDEGSNTLAIPPAHWGNSLFPHWGPWASATSLRSRAFHLSRLEGVRQGAFVSPGKDTTTGHWELCGVTLDKPFRTYPEGFPSHVIAAFEARSVLVSWEPPGIGNPDNRELERAPPHGDAHRLYVGRQRVPDRLSRDVVRCPSCTSGARWRGRYSWAKTW